PQKGPDSNHGFCAPNFCRRVRVRTSRPGGRFPVREANQVVGSALARTGPWRGVTYHSLFGYPFHSLSGYQKVSHKIDFTTDHLTPLLHLAVSAFRTSGRSSSRNSVREDWTTQTRQWNRIGPLWNFGEHPQETVAVIRLSLKGEYPCR